MYAKYLIVLFVFVGTAVLSVHSQTNVDIQGEETTIDSTIFSENSTGNSGGSDFMRAGLNGKGDIRRTLIRFDLSDIPPQSVILSAMLEIVVVDFAGNGPSETAQTLHRLNQVWTEGSGIDERGEFVDNAVSWNSTQEGVQLWDTPGGTFESQSSAEAIIPAEMNASIIWNGSGVVQDIQNWVNGDVPNYGWIIVGDENTSRSVRAYATSEFGEIEPKLHIEYTMNSSIEIWSLY